MRILKWLLAMAFVTIMLLGEWLIGGAINFVKELLWSAKFEWE
jgi:hypothetical protein